MIAAESGYEQVIETKLSNDKLRVNVDPLSIKRALANMITNAAHYGNGWIKVSSGDEPPHVWFQVEDDGPGIEANDLPNLLQPFVRGNSARTNKR